MKKEKKEELVEKEISSTEEFIQEKASEEETLNEIETLKKENAELNEKYIRKVAEFENYRKNMLKQQSELIKNGGERILTEMLSLIDDFERALDAIRQADDTESLREGVELIYNKFFLFLAKNGVKPIETDNADFDTDFHEAVTLLETPNEEQRNKVIECISKGYIMNEKVIRFAKVIVGK